MDHDDLSAAFTKIYQEDSWTHGSGPGSRSENTIEYRSFLARFMEANAIRSVTDLGCGDWQSSRFVDWTGIAYLGLDVVEQVIARNRELFLAPSIDFQIATNPDDLPGGDLLLCKDVLQHLPNDVISRYLAVIAQRYRFALITNDLEPEALGNQDIPVGSGRPIRLDAAPFFAKGAIVFTHFPQAGAHFWKKGTFLMLGGP